MAVADVKADGQTEEVRVAMALNGGVSLAVWMGGCAVEFDCARRAHLAAERSGTNQELPPDRTVYNGITEAFDRELVIDILSGASAGGINGALMAAAMRRARRISPTLLRNKWLDIGDFSRLLQPKTEREPRSIMQGNLFYNQLEAMFAAVLGAEEAWDHDLSETKLPLGQERLQQFDPWLDVMATNVIGEPHAFVDEWDQTLYALEYRAPLKFRESADFTPSALATAARASASFPVAFEPWEIGDGAAQLAGLPQARWAIDGGLLENAPIKSAIDLIPLRRAQRVVKRFVCYLNAAPPQRPKPRLRVKEPPLASVLGYVVNLPRDGRFVDQLYAVEEATRRGQFAFAVEAPLLEMDMKALRETAKALLPAYNARRWLLALEELFDGDVAEAQRVVELIGEPSVSWLPDTVDVPHAAQWNWGIRAAQRILYLELDIVRDALAESDTAEERKKVLLVRGIIEQHLEFLEGLRAAFPHNDKVRAELKRLVREKQVRELRDYVDLEGGRYREEIGCAVMAATAAFVAAPWPAKMKKRMSRMLESTWHARESPSEVFLRRALAIEVVRRSFDTDEDIVPAQTLHFAQLTPFATARIFSAEPFSKPGFPPGPDEGGERKLTGIRLGHFAGFYRRSWRANDFMWGRLDAAVRIVDLLVDGARACKLPADGRGERWKHLAEVLVEQKEDRRGAPLDQRRWLMHEALRDARHPTGGGARPPVAAVMEALSDYPDGDEPPKDLFEWTWKAIHADLSEKDGGLFTRVVCARAAQLEIMQQELKPLVKASKGDWKLGCFARPLALEPNDVRSSIETIRKWQEAPADKSDSWLPNQLGRDSGDESASRLALRTIVRTLFVTIAALQTARIPLSPALKVVRPPLLPIAGISSQGIIDRLAAVAGLSAAGFFVTARLLKTDKMEPTLGAVWSKPVLLTWMAALGILGGVFVPALRAYRSDSIPRKAGQAACAAAMFFLGIGVVVFLAAIWPGDIGVTNLVAGHGEHPREAIMWAALGALLGGVPALRFIGVPGWLTGLLEHKLLKSAPESVIVGAAAGITFIWSGPVIWPALWDGGWHSIAAWVTVANIFMCAGYVLIGRGPKRQQ